jgi:hypothetical protein
MKSKAATLGLTIIISLAIVVVMTAGSQFAFAEASHVRWDIVSINFGSFTVTAGGIASAMANDGSFITLTGTGTFVAPASGHGTSSAVSGGGMWTTHSSKGAVTGTGTYEVTGLVLWEPSPLPPGSNPPPTDLIEPSDHRSTGIAVLRITYSDGERGILIVSCEGYLSPASAFEGITATKGVTDYKSPVPPVAGVNANRTLFHIEE